MNSKTTYDYRFDVRNKEEFKGRDFMVKWRTFQISEKDFKNRKEYESYRENCRCAICHKNLENGDEYDLRSVQTPEEVESLSVIAVIIHKKCLG